MSRLKRFLMSSEQRTYCGNLQNPLARLEELRRRQSAVLENPEHLLSRLSDLAESNSSDDVPASADNQGGSAGS